MESDGVTPAGKSSSASTVKGVLVIVLIGILMVALIVGYRTYTERYRVSTGPTDDVAVSQVVRETFSGASDLRVASLSGTVQGVASDARALGLLNSTRVMKAPFTVDYFVDLSRMGPSDFLWNEATKTLTVHPPDVRVGKANIDEARTFIDKTEGIFVTRDAMAAMHRQASSRAGQVAYASATKPERLDQARAQARRDLQRLVGAPLGAAGLGKVTVEVVFPGEGTRSSDRWDVSRSIPEVIARPAG